MGTWWKAGRTLELSSDGTCAHDDRGLMHDSSTPLAVDCGSGVSVSCVQAAVCLRLCVHA